MGKVVTIGLAVVLSVTAGAYADMVSPGVGFSASGDSLTASLTASGSATVGGSGTYYSWVGWPASTWASVTISFNNQTVGIGTNPDTINVSKDPTGTGQVSFERLFTTLDNGSLGALDVDLLGGSPQNLALDRVTLTGDAAGLIDVEVRLDATGQITQLDFLKTGGITTGPNGQFYVPPIGQATYNGLWIGNATAGYNIAVDGELEVMGLFTIDLGELVSLSGSETLPGIPLPGQMTLTELGTEGVWPKDVAVHIATGLDQAIDVPFTTAGSEAINTYGGSKNPYYKVNFNYDFDGLLTVDNVGVDLYDTIQDIVPEPMTLAVFGLGGALLALTRRRK